MFNINQNNMKQVNIEFPDLDHIEQRLESLETVLKQIRNERAHHQFGLLNSKEAAKVLQITTRHLQNLRDRGDIGFVQYGRVVRYRPEDIQAHIDEHLVSPGKREGGRPKRDYRQRSFTL